MVALLGGQFAGLGLIAVVAAVLGIIARKSKQPTIIAYIATGLVLGSAGLSLVENSGFIELMSELGLGFLLFFIGLEIKINEIKQILKPVTIIAMVQMALTGLVAYTVTMLMGFEMIASLVIAAASMYGSTAVVVKLLADLDQETTLPGKLDVGMLLIEDIVVVILLALMSTQGGNISQFAISVVEIFFFIALIGVITYLSSQYFLPRLFQSIKDSQHTFFIYGLGWFFFMITLAEQVGMSMEIGAFFAGLSLGQVPYSSELRERVRPLTDFFMAVFFVGLGLELTLDTLGFYLEEALIASGVLMVAKFVIIFMVTNSQNFTPETSFKAAINKTQISEFALILGSLAVSQNFIDQNVLGFLSITAMVTMGISSYLITFNDKIYQKVEHLLVWFENGEKEELEIQDLHNHAVVIGYNELAKRALKLLEEEYDQVVIVDNDAKDTPNLASSDYEYIYGDFKHGEIRDSSGIKKADFILSVVQDHEVNKRILSDASEDATKFIQTDSMTKAAELYELDAHYVIMENILTGDKMNEYIELYLEDKQLFIEEVEREKERIKWGDRSV
ncbi:MAG: Kef-type K+ transport system membrane component KefB [Candidatus Nanohaloarchaea archaeon]|jgi:Kef-type K+ transport system membrane component KefB